MRPDRRGLPPSPSDAPHEALEIEAELESGPAPGQPADLVAKIFCGSSCCSHGAMAITRVGMHVIDVRKG